jgi:hypothetical protein
LIFVEQRVHKTTVAICNPIVIHGHFSTVGVFAKCQFYVKL